MQNNDDDEFKEDGSVWTSYSDLFTTVAVIFLVMFVFALIKSGVSKMQSMKEAKEHEQELKGKVSEVTKKKTQKKVEQVKSSLNQMQDYEELVNKKVQELNSFVKDLQKNKKVMNDLIEDQARKEAMLVSASEKVHTLDKNLKNQKETNKNLDNQLKKKVDQIKQLSSLQEQLKQQLEELNNRVKKRKEEIQVEKKQSKKLEEEITQIKKEKEIEAEQRKKSEQTLETISQELKQTQVILAKTEQTVSGKEKELNIRSIELNQQIKEKEAMLAKERENIEQIIAQSRKVDKINKDEIFKLKTKLEDLTKNVQFSEQKNKELKAGTFKLKKQLAEQSEEQAREVRAKNELQKQLDASHQSSQNQSKSIEKLKAELSSKQEALATSQTEGNQKDQRIKGLEAKANQLVAMTAGMESQIEQLEGSLAGANDKLAKSSKKVAGLEQKSSKLDQMNKNFENERRDLIKKIQGLQDNNKKKDEKNLIAAAKLNSCQENKQELRKQVAALKSDKVDLKDSLNNFAKKVSSIKGKLRSNIAKDLAEAFKKANLNVLVDNRTGNVVLLMDENFRFEKNSYMLNEKAKETLKKIIPIYSKVLFGNNKIKDKISSFNVVGHASPSYKGKYIEPLSPEDLAYSYNMRLSAQRAASITNFIFGEKVGDYNFKKMLKSYTKAIGQGFTKPVLKKVNINRSLASYDEAGGCGPYDCYGSQRVELNFSLKNDGKSLKNIINMAKEVAQ